MHAVIFTVQCSSQTCIKAVHRIINIMIPFFTFIFSFRTLAGEKEAGRI